MAPRWVRGRIPRHDVPVRVAARRAMEVGAKRLETGMGRMDMGVLETWEDHPAVEVDDPCSGARERANVSR